MKKVRKLEIGQFVQVPTYCFAPHRSGWNGWSFDIGQIVKVGKTNDGVQAAVVEFLHDGKEMKKAFAIDTIFDAKEAIGARQLMLKGFTDEDLLKADKLRWLHERGAISREENEHV